METMQGTGRAELKASRKLLYAELSAALGLVDMGEVAVRFDLYADYFRKDAALCWASRARQEAEKGLAPGE